MGNGWYDTAQICLNGHVISRMAQSAPESNEKFCAKCGDATITTCQHCQTSIRGEYHVPGVVNIGFEYPTTGFCHNCGQPYPWTDARLKAAQELAEELDGLSKDERETLKLSLPDIVQDTPRSPVAAIRFKRLVAKAGKEAAGAFRDLLVDVASETAKKAIWP